jgi:protein ImuA
MVETETRTRRLGALRKQIQECGREVSRQPASVRSTGCRGLDELLTHQGIGRGTLVEWLGDGMASGAATLSLTVGRAICPEGRPVVLIDRLQVLFPLALKLLGFDLARIVIVRPSSEQEALWAFEETLRCAGVGFVWANIERLSGTSFRRLQLAAETANGVGFLLRSARALPQPSWAESRLVVRPLPLPGGPGITSRSAASLSPPPFPSCEGSPGFRVETASLHGRPRRSRIDILLDRFRGTIHELAGSRPANPLPVASRLADAAADRAPSGA